MRIKFDANQEFQIKAVDSVIDLFDGQPKTPNGYLEFGQSQSTLFPPETKGQLQFIETLPGIIANKLQLDETTLLSNLKKIQVKSGVQADEGLNCIEESIETIKGPASVRFPNFSVEMETGTGKTYVYLRTALELFRHYGFRKFIVVVPSIAIREGVLKTFEITKAHFAEIFGNTSYRFYVYDSENLSQVRQFAQSPTVEFMVMTIDSFNKASNVIRQTTDRLQGETPIHLIQAARPILILDEPQNMESELRIKALSALDPLFALRYSATHRNPYNLVYRLTPFEAYRQGLVKKIEVASVLQEDDANRVFIRVESIKAAKRTLTARIAIHKLMANGSIKEKIVTIKPGDSLETLSGRNDYAGFDVDEINSGGGFVRFTNDVEIRTGESRGVERDAIFEAQIRYTIEEHFRKQEKLRTNGIKVLSLFFIDKVNNYAQHDGVIRQLFNRHFTDLKSKFPAWKDIPPDVVQAAYFAQKKRKGGLVEVRDSSSGKSKEDEEAYDLIMKDKEVLLGFPSDEDDEATKRKKQVCFIFSHSALREGWDNPNVFQICTLNQTASEIKKRQEIGRGVRLSVNQEGIRVFDERVNVLTVVANENYERYVEKLQSEIEQDYGLDGVPPKPADARKKSMARFRKEYKLKPEFKELWDRIKYKTQYSVKIDTEKLLSDVKEGLSQVQITPPRLTITKAKMELREQDNFEAYQQTATRTVTNLAGRYPLPNLVETMGDLLDHSTPPVRLTRKTLLEIFNGVEDKEVVMNNPMAFATTAVAVIREKLADHLVNGIQYEKLNEWYEMTQLETDIETWKDYMIPAERSVYDHVVVDAISSDPGESLEANFVRELERRDDVKLFLKLPDWFRVPTPVGDYNPDWAIVMEERDSHGQVTGKPLLYLVSETKGENWRTSLRPDELRKVKCGAAHFGSKQFNTKGALEDVDYKVVSHAGELLDQ